MSNKLYILFLILFFGVSSCNSFEDSIRNDYPIDMLIQDTKSGDTLTDNYLVNDQDLSAYTHYLNTIVDNDRGVVTDITPISSNNTPAAFIINFEKGWQILSSDKRGPIVLADSKDGHFSLEEANDGVLAWINMLIDDINYRRIYAEDYYKSIDDEAKKNEEYCLNYWKAINADTDYIISQTKTKDHELMPDGHFELDYTYLTTEVRDSITHLMTTSWRQSSPYNDFIPLVSGSTTKRCPAGCTAIATAQVLYYLHYHLGVPLTSPSYGYCFGDENDYEMYFDNYVSTTWDNMLPNCDSLHYTSMFIADIACKVGTHFHEDASWTLFINKVATQACPAYGISCSHNYSYDADIVYQNLCNSLPVIFSGSNKITEGHTFVIDGYDNTVTKTHFVYKYVIDSIPDPDGGFTELPVPIGGAQYYEEIVASSPVMRHFFLNWGWGSIDNTPYSTNGYWSDSDGNLYQYFREIVYGFQVD